MSAIDDTSASIIKSVPDSNSKEAILYGSEYIFAKSARYFWDQVEDHLKKKLAETLDEINDMEFALFVVNEAPNLLTMTSPPLEIDQIRDLRVLSEWIDIRKALYLLEIKRKENDQYARLVGVSEYSRQRGTITETDWKAAILQANDPLDYESIRAIKDMDAKLSEYESQYEQERMNAYRRFRGMAEHSEEAETDKSEVAADEGLDSIEIYEEVGTEDSGDATDSPAEESDDIGEETDGPEEESDDIAEDGCDDAAELINDEESEEQQEETDTEPSDAEVISEDEPSETTDESEVAADEESDSAETSEEVENEDSGDTDSPEKDVTEEGENDA